jgi:hypothetical protein
MDLEKIVFTMTEPEQKKHSVRFNFEALSLIDNETDVPDAEFQKTFKPTFYVPKPFAQNAKRIRVTVEVVE